VSVFFNNSAKLTKRNSSSIVQALAETVLSTKVPTTIEEGPVRVPQSELPDLIGGITIWASVDGHDRLWSADSGGWVTGVQPHHIQAILDAKAACLALARKKCSSVWLVIVNDLFTRAAPAELDETASMTEYIHGFDRLFWLETHEPRTIELKSPANKSYKADAVNGAA
jgi:hypothetical protein